MKKSSCESPSSLSTKGVTINLANCKYTVFRKVAAKLGWEVTDDEVNWDIMWCDAGLGIEKYLRVAKTYQRINHFPGMINIYRKDKLAKSMAKMSRISNLYDFTPKTWVLPQDYQQIVNYLRSANRCVIMKPSAGAQGRGIFLAMKPEQIINSEEQYIVQSYLHRPLLVDGYKFDLRIYVLITCCDPLRILLFREGLCRFCTNPYQRPNAENLMNTFMHLTNYSINKHNEEFVQPQQPDSRNTTSNESSNDAFTNIDLESLPSASSKGPSTSSFVPSNQQNQHSSKRSLTWLRGWLRSHGVDDNIVWQQIADIVVKTIISAQAPVSRAFSSYKVNGMNKNPFSCFELLGFDIILDEKCNPFLLEVNHMPSFSTDSPLDHDIKFALISNTLQLLNVSRRERVHWQRASMMQSQVRLYGDLFDQRQRSSPSPVQVTSRNASPIPPHQGSDNISNTANKSGKASKVGKDPTTSFNGNEVAVFWQRYLENEGRRLKGFDLVYPTDVYPAQPTRGRQRIYDELLGLADLVFQTGYASIRGLSMPLLSTGPSNVTVNQSTLAENGKEQQPEQEQVSLEEESISSKQKKAKKKKVSTRMKQKRKELMLLPDDAQDQDLIMLLYTPAAIISPKKNRSHDTSTKPTIAPDPATIADSLPKVVTSNVAQEEFIFPPSHIMDSIESKLSNATLSTTPSIVSAKGHIGDDSNLNLLHPPPSLQVPLSPRNSIQYDNITVATDINDEEEQKEEEEVTFPHSSSSVSGLQPSPPAVKAVRPSFQHLSPQRRRTPQQQSSPSYQPTVSDDNASLQPGVSMTSSFTTSSPADPRCTSFQSIHETMATADGKNATLEPTEIKEPDIILINPMNDVKDEVTSSHDEKNWSLNRLQQERLEALLRIANHRGSPLTKDNELRHNDKSVDGDYSEYDSGVYDYYSDNQANNHSFVTTDVHRRIIFDDNQSVSKSVTSRNDGDNEDDDDVDYFYYDQDPDLYISFSFQDEVEEEVRQDNSEPTILSKEVVMETDKDTAIDKSQSKESLSLLIHDIQSCVSENDDLPCLVSSVSPLDNSFEQSSSTVLSPSQAPSASPAALISQQEVPFLYRYSQLQSPAISSTADQIVKDNSTNIVTAMPDYDNIRNVNVPVSQVSMTPSLIMSNTPLTTPTVPVSSSLQAATPSPNAAVLLSSGFTMDVEFRQQYAAYRVHYLSTLNPTQKR